MLSNLIKTNTFFIVLLFSRHRVKTMDEAKTKKTYRAFQQKPAKLKDSYSLCKDLWLVPFLHVFLLNYMIIYASLTYVFYIH